MRSTDISPVRFLSQMPMFRQLGPAELERVAARTQQIHLTRGDVIFHAGTDSTGMYVVIFGQVKLVFTSPRGDEKVVDVVQAGGTFGEAVMFLCKPYPVTAQALGDTMLLYVQKEIIFEEIRREPDFAARMIAGLSMRVHGLMADLEAYSMRNGVQRVIGFLLRECEESRTTPDVEPNGEAELRLPTSKSVIASRLNITQEHFSRILHELIQRDLIEVDGRSIRVRDVDRLREHMN
ncbi:MAG: Crp/Fnr family transcriptional regulator [Burkholderiaceae bacterium]|nr:Crp/Fnr family transcriptional regulator [Burkholderiaceae bacterium]